MSTPINNSRFKLYGNLNIRDTDSTKLYSTSSNKNANDVKDLLNELNDELVNVTEKYLILLGEQPE